MHGNLFEELRNNAMDARGFFANQAPILKQSDFGGTVGGPVYIPKVYNGKNKTFFFATYQGFRNRAGRNIQTLTVPTAANYQGDFRGWTRSGVMAPIYDPASTRLAPSGSGYVRDLFPNNMIPQNRFSGVATRFIALRPAEHVAHEHRQLLRRPRQQLRHRFRQHQFAMGQGQHSHRSPLNSKNRLSGLYLKGQNVAGFGADGPPGLPMPFNGGAVTTTQSQSLRISLDTHVSPRIINTFRGSYQKEAGVGECSPPTPYKFNEKLQIPGVPAPTAACLN